METPKGLEHQLSFYKTPEAGKSIIPRENKFKSKCFSCPLNQALAK
jgi:hypothetical protein